MLLNGHTGIISIQKTSKVIFRDTNSQYSDIYVNEKMNNYIKLLQLSVLTFLLCTVAYLSFKISMSRELQCLEDVSCTHPVFACCPGLNTLQHRGEVLGER